MTNEKKKGYREIIKQLADRRRSYSLSHYVRAVQFHTGKSVKKSDIVTAIKRIKHQYDYRGLEITGGRVYNYTLAA
jgi:hypothetical protein